MDADTHREAEDQAVGQWSISRKSLFTMIALLLLAANLGCGDSNALTPTLGSEATATHETGAGELRAVLPDLAEVRAMLGLNLVEHNRPDGLGQAFEGTETEHLVVGYRNVYRGSTDEGAASIQLAVYETTEAAVDVAGFIRTIELEHAGRGERLDLSGIGDEQFGHIFPPSAANEFVTTAALLRSGRVVVFITVLSHNEGGLSDETRRLAEIVIERLQQVIDMPAAATEDRPILSM